jgi:membrane-bound ClpP family serine protease
MNLISRTITGIMLIMPGIALIVWGIFNKSTWIHGIILLVLGIFILLNNKEDMIEKIKKRKGGK